MTTFIFTLSLVGIAMVAMAVGVIFSDRVLQGSCGGFGSEDCMCSLEKRRACALEEKARRAEERSGARLINSSTSGVSAEDHNHSHDHDTTR